MRSSTPTERVVSFLLDPGRRFRGLILLAYGTAITGLSIGLLPGSLVGQRTVAISLMFFAFVLLFYLSVTAVETGGGRERP